jgi:drug/metabolite transporter (DMT)-like permease
MAVPFLKEGANAVKLMGLLFGFAGVLVLSVSRLSIEELSSSFYFLLLGAFLWAISTIFYKKFITDIDSLIASFLQLSVGAFLLGLIDITSGNFYWPSSMNYLLPVLYSSIGTLSIALSIWLYLLRREDAITLSSSSFIIPLVAFIFGLIVLVEPIELQSIFGAFLIVIGVYLVNRQPK